MYKISNTFGVCGEIAKERVRQVEEKGLATASGTWPFDVPMRLGGGVRRDLIKAAALIVAEIERLDREAGR